MLITKQEAEKDIQQKLKARGVLIVQSTINHEWPYCWRSKTPLMWRSVPAWFIRVQQSVDQLVANNAETLW
jgi:isoleucyl-tRNA synthetase